MEPALTCEDRRKIEESLKRKYVKVAITPEGLFRYPTGRAGLEGLNYDAAIIRVLPESAAASYCGVGNPFTFGTICAGETVLDIGCGGGVDTLIAAIMVGPTGAAVGIDMTPEMLARAQRNLEETSLNNVSFQQASGEDLPFPDRNFDVVISNGVFNLVPDKARTLAEVFRVLKPGGRLLLADQILAGELPRDTEARVANWAR